MNSLRTITAITKLSNEKFKIPRIRIYRYVTLCRSKSVPLINYTPVDVRIFFPIPESKIERKHYAMSPLTYNTKRLPPTRFQRDSTAIPDRGLRSTADLPRMDSRPRKISESRYAGLYFDLFGARISRFLLPREAGRGEACNNIYKAVRLGKQSTVYRIRWWQMPRA